MAMTSEKIILDAASRPPKRLREFWPFLLPLAFIVILLAAHAILFWVTRSYGESGLFIQRDGRYVEAFDRIREFILCMSGATIFCFVILCVLGHSLWLHKKVIHELWKKTQSSP